MSDDESESIDLATSLCNWVAAFRAELHEDSKCESLDDLSDGLALFDVLAYLEPSHFDPDEAKLKREHEDSALLKTANLRTLIVCLQKALEDHHVFDRSSKADPLSLLDEINYNSIARHSDRTETLKLLELTVVVGVNSSRKDEAVQHIMQLPETSQHQIMFIIQSTMDKYQAESPQHSPQVSPRKVSEKISNELKEQLEEAQKDNELFQGKIASLKAETRDLNKQIHDLNEQMTEMKLAHQRELGETVQQTKRELEEKRKSEVQKHHRTATQLQQARHDAENEVEMLRLKLETLEKKYKEELDAAKEENRKMGDELYLQSERAKKLDRVEATLQKYKDKVAEMNTMELRMRELQESHKEDVETINSLKKQIEMGGASKDKMEEVTRELDRLRHELEEAKEEKEDHEAVFQKMLKEKDDEIERLKMDQSGPDSHVMISSSVSGMSLADQDFDSIDDENTSSSADQEAALAREKQRAENLKQKYRESQRRNKELEVQLEALKNKPAAAAVDHPASRASRAMSVASGEDITTYKEEVAKLKRKLSVADGQIEKLSTFARKAKKFDTNRKETERVLRQRITYLEEDANLQRKYREESGEQWRREQRLMSSAFYELGKQLQAHVHFLGRGTEGPASGATPHRNSWLNKQRQRVTERSSHHK